MIFALASASASPWRGAADGDCVSRDVAAGAAATGLLSLGFADTAACLDGGGMVSTGLATPSVLAGGAGGATKPCISVS